MLILAFYSIALYGYFFRKFSFCTCIFFPFFKLFIFLYYNKIKRYIYPSFRGLFIAFIPINYGNCSFTFFVFLLRINYVFITNMLQRYFFLYYFFFVSFPPYILNVFLYQLLFIFLYYLLLFEIFPETNIIFSLSLLKNNFLCYKNFI